MEATSQYGQNSRWKGPYILCATGSAYLLCATGSAYLLCATGSASVVAAACTGRASGTQ